jgi:hypothetical protein
MPCLPAWQPCLSDWQLVIHEIQQAFGPFILSSSELHAACTFVQLHFTISHVPTTFASQFKALLSTPSFLPPTCSCLCPSLPSGLPSLSSCWSRGSRPSCSSFSRRSASSTRPGTLPQTTLRNASLSTMPGCQYTTRVSNNATRIHFIALHAIYVISESYLISQEAGLNIAGLHGRGSSELREIIAAAEFNLTENCELSMPISLIATIIVNNTLQLLWVPKRPGTFQTTGYSGTWTYGGLRSLTTMN